MQDMNSTMSSTVSSSSPDGSFINFLRQDSHHSNTFCPSSPQSPVIRQQNVQPQFVRNSSSYSDDSQGIGSRGQAASPIINQSCFSPLGATNNFSIDARSSRSYSGDSLLPPPPNLDSSVDSFRQDNDPPFTSTPTKPGLPLSGGNANRDRSYSSPNTNLRQLPIGARSPLPPSNQQASFENKVSSSWNEGPGFPSPNVYKSVTQSNPGAPGDRFSSRPPRYGVNKDISPQGDNFNLSSQTSYYSNQTNSLQNQNHVRSQSLGVGFGGSQVFNSIQLGMSNSHNNSFDGGGMNEE